MISQDTIAKIMDTVRIDEVVGDFVNLKRAGANLKGVCPFHNEKTPSFLVSPAKNIYKCFGCGEAGDSVKFVMEHEKMSYPEALRYLAEKYQIEIEETHEELSPEQKANQSFKDSLFIVMKYAATYYQDKLHHSDEGKSVGLSYFKHRDFLQKTIEEFQLGYAPEGFTNFSKDALDAGYQKEILEGAGLVRLREDGSPYDFFRGRVMFPIHNLSGKVVAFGGRIMTNDKKQAKYINTPETEIYTKGKLVYGIYQAKNEIRREDACILVEGYTDVLSLHQAGILNVVASSGTALTSEQVRLIGRYSKNAILLYDGDQAGIKAALRGVDIMLDLDMDVKIVVLPENEDPDSFVRKSGSDATIKYIEENKKDFIFFKADILLKEAKDDPVKKSEAVKDIVESIAFVNDNIKRTFYLKECSRLTELPEDVLIQELNKAILRKLKRVERLSETTIRDTQNIISTDTHIKKQQELQRRSAEKSGIEFQEREILRVVLTHGHKDWTNEDGVSEVKVIDYIFSQIKGIDFEAALYQKLWRKIIQEYENGIAIEELLDENYYEEEDIKSFIISNKISPYELSPHWESAHHIIVKTIDDVWENDVFSAVNRYILNRIKIELKKIDEEIKKIESEDTDKLFQLLQTKMDLQDPKKTVAEKFGTIIY